MATGAEIKAELDSISGMGQEFQQRATEMQEQIGLLASMVGDSAWTGQAADAFRAGWDATKAKLELLRTACQETGQSLIAITQKYGVDESGRMKNVQTTYEQGGSRLDSLLGGGYNR
jgi:uncharacterized protein YukE